MTIKASTRSAVDERDGGRCRRCGRSVAGREFSRHHRKPRGMGNRNRADQDRLSNLVTLCGSATTPDGCHRWAETNRNLAREQGWLLYDIDDPEEVAVQDVAGGWSLLDDDGGVTFAG